MTDQSIMMSHLGKFVNFFEIFSLHEHTTITLWLFHYYWPFETQDDWNCHIFVCLSSISWHPSLPAPLFMDQQCHKPILGAPDVGLCLLPSIGGGRAAVAAAAQWPGRVPQRRRPSSAICTHVTCAPLSFRAWWQPIWSSWSFILSVPTARFVCKPCRYLYRSKRFLLEKSTSGIELDNHPFYPCHMKDSCVQVQARSFLWFYQNWAAASSRKGITS